MKKLVNGKQVTMTTKEVAEFVAMQQEAISTSQPEPEPVSPADKLAQFLNANPGVKALIEGN